MTKIQDILLTLYSAITKIPKDVNQEYTKGFYAAISSGSDILKNKFKGNILVFADYQLGDIVYYVEYEDSKYQNLIVTEGTIIQMHIKMVAAEEVVTYDLINNHLEKAFQEKKEINKAYLFPTREEAEEHLKRLVSKAEYQYHKITEDKNAHLIQ